MPKISKQSAPDVSDAGLAEDRGGRLGDYAVDFVTIRQAHSLAPLLAGLPGDLCPCPHWGYLLAGQITVTYADREEVITAGDAFYLPPGHAPSATEGTQIVQFSPADQLADVQAVMMANAQRIAQGA
jgi:hypothetical protein